MFADNMILSVENSQDSTPKLLELINEFSQIAGYKSNHKMKFKKSIPFTIIWNKYLNLIKEIKTYMLETIKQCLKKWKKTQINERHLLFMD